MATLTLEQYEQIRELAYQQYVARGYKNGHDVEDWSAAEQEVLSSEEDDDFSEWDIMEPFGEEVLVGDQLEEELGYRVG